MMNIKIVLLLLLFLLVVTVSAQNNITVYFKFDSYNLDSEQEHRIKSFIAQFGSPIQRISLSGHTDSLGTVDYNQNLAVKRVEKVKKYILAIYPGVIAFNTRGFGESVPVGDNFTESGRELNRRVEIEVCKCNTISKDSAIIPSDTVTITSPVKKEEVWNITGEKGTIINIPKDAFFPVPDSLIELKITEFLTVHDMMEAGLFPIDTSGIFLSSEGMIFFECNFHLSGTKEIEIMIPASTIDPEMKVYTMNDSSGNRWEITDIPWKKVEKNGISYYVVKSKNLNPINIDKFLGIGDGMHEIKARKGRIMKAWAYSEKANTVFPVSFLNRKRIFVPKLDEVKDLKLIIITRTAKRNHISRLSLEAMDYKKWRDIYIVGRKKFYKMKNVDPNKIEEWVRDKITH